MLILDPTHRARVVNAMTPEYRTEIERRDMQSADAVAALDAAGWRSAYRRADAVKWTILLIALIAPMGAGARDHICAVKRVTTPADSAVENKSSLTVYAFLPSGISILRSDGTRSSENYVADNAQYFRASQDRIRAGEKPLPPPARLAKGLHFVLNRGDQAHASLGQHHRCLFIAEMESGGPILKLEATSCQHGGCSTTTEVVAPEVVQQ